MSYEKRATSTIAPSSGEGGIETLSFSQRTALVLAHSSSHGASAGKLRKGAKIGASLAFVAKASLPMERPIGRTPRGCAPPDPTQGSGARGVCAIVARLCGACHGEKVLARITQRPPDLEAVGARRCVALLAFMTSRLFGRPLRPGRITARPTARRAIVACSRDLVSTLPPPGAAGPRSRASARAGAARARAATSSPFRSRSASATGFTTAIRSSSRRWTSRGRPRWSGNCGRRPSACCATTCRFDRTRSCAGTATPPCACTLSTTGLPSGCSRRATPRPW